MRLTTAILFVGALLAPAGFTPYRALPVARANPNIDRAGALHRGVLSVALEATEGQWMPGSHQRPLRIEAFSEAGKLPTVPGPFIRAPQGTEIRISVRNSLSFPLTFLLPAAIHGGDGRPDAWDSLVVAPGAVGHLTTHATVPGNYAYRAIGPDHASAIAEMTGALAGGIVIDSAGAAGPPHDRVLVIMALPDTGWVARQDRPNAAPPRIGDPGGQFTYTINGRTWPHTERITATVGDTLHWRVINASGQVHAMHLHGFYFRVDALTGPNLERVLRAAPGQMAVTPGQMVVTQFMPQFSAMSVTWSPNHPGNWLFHCHFAVHLEADPYLGAPDDPHGSGMPEMRDMAGMALGVEVADRPGTQQAALPSTVRRLRLIAESRPKPAGNGGADTVPSMHFVLEEHGRRVEGTPELSPELDLTRGEPVSITIVNHLAEATSVHWHGIEVEDSYVDGVPGFSGAGTHLAPAIAPGDSFVARFTPPRSGTFMYHAHMDEKSQQMAGLEGAIVVRDSGVAPSADDHTFFLKGLNGDPRHPLEINGEADPDTIVLHVGQPARLRFLNLATVALAPMVSLTARPDSALSLVLDTMVVEWRPMAKDGFDYPASARQLRPARQMVTVGETYDFEFVPTHAGNLRLEIRKLRPVPPAHQLFVRVPIRVE